jgi:hypothetical protein
MSVLRRLVFAALCAGLISNILLPSLIISARCRSFLKAEISEKAFEHATATAHEHATWEPENGAERTAYTLLKDTLTAIGFALLLAAGLARRRDLAGRAILGFGGLCDSYHHAGPGLIGPPDALSSRGQTVRLAGALVWHEVLCAGDFARASAPGCWSDGSVGQSRMHVE